MTIPIKPKHGQSRNEKIELHIQFTKIFQISTKHPDSYKVTGQTFTCERFCEYCDQWMKIKRDRTCPKCDSCWDNVNV